MYNHKKKYSRKKNSRKNSRKNSKKSKKISSNKSYKISRTIINNKYETFLKPYSSDYKKALIDLSKILSTIDYPFLKYFTKLEKIRQNFISLKNFKPLVIHEQYNLSSINLSQEQLKFNGKYFLIIDQPFEYDSIELISDFFNEECRVHCKFITENYSIFQFYRNNLDLIIKYLEKGNRPLTLENIRETIWHIGYKECTTFKPKLEKFFIEYFKAKNILDISSGWGDRLIGAMASDIDLYHGFDPNPCLHKNYKKIIETFKDLQTNPDAKFIIKKLPFEKAVLKNNFYDLVMTSPPYFNMEIYDSAVEQSVSTTDTSPLQEKYWYENYLLVWMNKCFHALKKGGIIAININQSKNQNYVYWLLNDMKKLFTFLGTISHSKPNKKNPQPTFIWKKN